MSTEIIVTSLKPEHWSAVSRIYGQGIETRNATFETIVPDWGSWDAARHPFCRYVAVGGGEVVGWVAFSPVSKRAVYAGVAEHSVYVDEKARGRGVGRLLMDALVQGSEQNGIWMIQTSIFPENAASIKLHESCGFRVVGRRERIAQLDGIWRDTVMMERRSKVVGAS